MRPVFFLYSRDTSAIPLKSEFLCVCVCVYIWMVFQDCLFYVRKRRGYNRYFFFYFCDTRKTITSSVYEKEFPVFLHSVRFFMTAEDVIIYCGSVNRMSVC